MTNKLMFRGALTALAGVLLGTASFSFLAAQEANVAVYSGIKGAAKLRIVQTPSPSLQPDVRSRTCCGW